MVGGYRKIASRTCFRDHAGSAGGEQPTIRSEKVCATLHGAKQHLGIGRFKLHRTEASDQGRQSPASEYRSQAWAGTAGLSFATSRKEAAHRSRPPLSSCHSGLRPCHSGLEPESRECLSRYRVAAVGAPASRVAQVRKPRPLRLEVFAIPGQARNDIVE